MSTNGVRIDFRRVATMPCMHQGRFAEGHAVSRSSQWRPCRINVAPVEAVPYRCRPNDGHIVSMNVRWWPCLIDVSPLNAMLCRQWSCRVVVDPMINSSYLYISNIEHGVSISVSYRYIPVDGQVASMSIRWWQHRMSVRWRAAMSYRWRRDGVHVVSESPRW